MKDEDRPDRAVVLLAAAFLLVASWLTGGCGSGGGYHDRPQWPNPPGPFSVQLRVNIRYPREGIGQPDRTYRVEIELYADGDRPGTGEPQETFPDIVGQSGEYNNLTISPTSQIRDRAYLVFAVMYDDENQVVRQGFVSFTVDVNGRVTPYSPTIDLTN